MKELRRDITLEVFGVEVLAVEIFGISMERCQRLNRSAQQWSEFPNRKGCKDRYTGHEANLIRDDWFPPCNFSSDVFQYVVLPRHFRTLDRKSCDLDLRCLRHTCHIDRCLAVKHERVVAGAIGAEIKRPTTSIFNKTKEQQAQTPHEV